MPLASAPSEAYELDPQTRVYRRRSSPAPFAYNDGDEVEERLLRVVSQASDLSVLSLELASQIVDWPSRYHLSATRANLLRPLEPRLHGRILEIGAGCGAVTRYLGECGAEVVAVEGSYRRACVAAARCRDLPNVRVVCDRFEDYPANERFDVVTLIGVLEWVRLFGTAADPVQTVLERTRGFLREQGSLLLAIENQLGLKYFAGYVEDHTCVPMLGIDDLYDARSPVTFGRRELTERLRLAGYPESELFVPLPDYKLPVAVITPSGLVDEGWPETRASIVSASVGADPQQLPVPLFSLEKAFRVVSRNDLVPDLASSFLIRASTTPAERRPASDAVLAISYASSRRPAFAKQTSIERCDGRLVVRRRRLANGAAEPGLPLRQREDDEPFRPGRLWTDALSDIVNKPGWTLEQLAGWTRRWVAALADGSGVSATDVHAVLHGRWLDATPFNLVEGPSGELHFIDLEWETEQTLELGFLVWRGLYSSLNKLRTVAEPAAAVPRRYWDAVAGTMALLELPLAPADLERYTELDIRIQQWATGLAGPSPEDRRLAVLPVRVGLLALSEHLADVERLQRLEHDLKLTSESLRQRTSEVTQLRYETLRLGRDAAETWRELDASRRAHTRTRRELDVSRSGRGARVLAQLRRAGGGVLGTLRLLRPGAAAQLVVLARRPAVVADAIRIVRRGLFDGEFYRCRYGDVSGDPLLHYLRHGHKEGRWPNPLFDPEWYAARRAPGGSRPLLLADFAVRGASDSCGPHPLFDVAYYRSRFPVLAQLGINPLAHYLRTWSSERQSPHPLFDTEWYLTRNPDVDASGVEPVSHFWSCGAAEERDPHPLFSVEHYLRSNPDVAAAGVQPLQHFLERGGREGRSPHPLFDSAHYLARYEDVRLSGLNPLVHYLTRGAAEGRSPNPLFDPRFYLAQYPDVAASGVNPLVHYACHGAREGRRTCAGFDPDAYLAAHPDVARSGLDPLTHCLLHGGAPAAHDEGRP